MIQDCTIDTVMEFCRDAKAFTTPRIMSFYKNGSRSNQTYKLTYDKKGYYHWRINVWRNLRYISLSDVRSAKLVLNKISEDLK